MCEDMMTKKPECDPAEEQSFRLKRRSNSQVDAGELTNTEAGEELDRLVRNSPSTE
jgi:hypothetical protein